MKTKKPLLLLYLFAALLLTTGLKAQIVRTITLQVTSDELNADDPSKACRFMADSDTEVLDNSSPEKFTILVNEDDVLIWEGISDTGQEVTIENIVVEEVPGQNSLFRKSKLNGRIRDGKKKVKGKVKNDIKGNEYKYTVAFAVGGDTYLIDPKIKVKN